MEYLISGSDKQILRITLSEKEVLFAVSNSKVSADDNIKEKSLMHGGIVGGLKRKIAGEQLYLKKYTAFRHGGTLEITPKIPCKIAPVILNNQCVICKTDSFLCCEGSISVDIVFAGTKIEGFPWREGHFLEKISGTGVVFIKAGSNLAEINLSEKEKLRLLDRSFAGADIRMRARPDFRVSGNDIAAGRQRTL